MKIYMNKVSEPSKAVVTTKSMSTENKGLYTLHLSSDSAQIKHYKD